MEQLNYFRALSTRLDAERVAYLAAADSLRDSINAATAAVATIEKNGGNASKERENARRLKAERANLKAPSFVDPLPDVEAWARTHTKAAKAEPVQAKVPTGQTPLAAHNNLSEKTNAIIAEIARVNATPDAPGDVIESVTRNLDAIATPPRLLGGKLVFPRHVVDSNGMALTVVNTEGLLAWLHRDTLIAAATKLAGDGGPTMTAAERTASLTTLHEKFTNALRFEAAAARAAEEAGQRVVRRRHVHPAILLNLQIEPDAVWRWFATRKGA
jgi:hypothetical protein